MSCQKWDCNGGAWPHTAHRACHGGLYVGHSILFDLEMVGQRVQLLGLEERGCPDSICSLESYWKKTVFN